MLAPGRTISPIWHRATVLPEGEAVPLRYEAHADYTNLDGMRYEDPALVLDLLPFKNSVIEREDLHELAPSLKNIRNVM